MNNYLKNIWFADFLGAELSFFILTFITGTFNQTEKTAVALIISGIFLIRYLFFLKQKTGIKLVEISTIILVIILSYIVDIRLILV
ncbi:MAG TPA: hypothetical protein ENK92_01010, partial [Bacteroidetes bacterium]|nr:hypothetical protein [Bacteroidota bacterium]